MYITDFSTDPEWTDIFYSEPDPEDVIALDEFLTDCPLCVVRLYHGTSADVPVLAEGLLPTSEERRHSLQSRPDYVSLSVYPGTALMFGKMAYPNKPVAVYSVQLPVMLLVPDTDQLKNQRMWAGRDVGDSLAESLAYGHGAQVYGAIEPYRIRLVESDNGPIQI